MRRANGQRTGHCKPTERYFGVDDPQLDAAGTSREEEEEVGRAKGARAVTGRACVRAAAGPRAVVGVGTPFLSVSRPGRPSSVRGSPSHGMREGPRPPRTRKAAEAMATEGAQARDRAAEREAVALAN